MHGLEIIKVVREKLPSTRILVLTGHPDGELPAQLIREGVHGFVDKTEPPELCAAGGRIRDEGRHVFRGKCLAAARGQYGCLVGSSPSAE